MRIAIIGGGAYGTAIAHFLESFDGSHEIHLFEKNSLASGSTGKSAGIVRHHYFNKEHIKFAKRGREILEKFSTEVNAESGFQQNGYLIMSSGHYEETFRQIIEIQRNVGLNVELLSPEEIVEHHPEASTKGVTAAALEHEGGFADPHLVTTGFAKSARKMGTEIHTNTPVTNIEAIDGTVTTLYTDGDQIDVDFVINAAGPWASEVAELLGISLPLNRYEAKLVVLSASEPYDTAYPTVSDIDSGFYAKPEETGNFIAGGMERVEGHQPLNDRSDLEGVTNKNLEQLSELVEQRLPGFNDIRLVNSWSELITAPPDWHQIIGRPLNYENFYVVAGGSGHGFKEAPGFAESIAKEILGQNPDLDLKSYRPNRFYDGNTFEIGYDEGTRS